MSAIGPRTYLVGKVLPVMLAHAPGSGKIDVQATADALDETIRLTLYIVDLTLARMSNTEYKENPF